MTDKEAEKAVRSANRGFNTVTERVVTNLAIGMANPIDQSPIAGVNPGMPQFDLIGSNVNTLVGGWRESREVPDNELKTQANAQTAVRIYSRDKRAVSSGSDAPVGNSTELLLVDGQDKVVGYIAETLSMRDGQITITTLVEQSDRSRKIDTRTSQGGQAIDEQHITIKRTGNEGAHIHWIQGQPEGSHTVIGKTTLTKEQLIEKSKKDDPRINDFHAFTPGTMFENTVILGFKPEVLRAEGIDPKKMMRDKDARGEVRDRAFFVDVHQEMEGKTKKYLDNLKLGGLEFTVKNVDVEDHGAFVVLELTKPLTRKAWKAIKDSPAIESFEPNLPLRLNSATPQTRTLDVPVAQGNQGDYHKGVREEVGFSSSYEHVGDDRSAQLSPQRLVAQSDPDKSTGPAKKGTGSSIA